MAKDPPKDPPRNRDRRQVFPMPEGVRAQTAPESFESHSEVTPQVNMALTKEERSAIDVAEAPRRVRETKNVAISTLQSVESVRAELKTDINRIEGKVDGQGVILGELRGDVGSISGQLPLIVDNLQSYRDELVADRAKHTQMRVTAFQAEIDLNKSEKQADIEVNKEEKLADIEVRKTGKLAVVEVKKFLALKIIAGAALAGVAILGFLQARAC